MEIHVLERPLRAVLVLMALCFLAACASSRPVTPGLTVNAPDPAFNQQIFSESKGENYILRPFDVISVDVFRESDLSNSNLVIAADGNISLPLVGMVKAAGLTVAQLQTKVKDKLGAHYLRDPQVAVNVVDYNSHQVTVEGAVTHPGIYAFMPGMRLSGAIALAQGPTRVAKMNEVAVFRPTANGLEIAKFDFSAVEAGTMIDPVMMPGDRVVVGTDGLSQFWQDALKALPAFAVFSQTKI